MKNLRKKVRQIEELKQKVDAGQVTPNSDQVEKLQRYDQLKKELAELEEMEKKQ